MADLKETLAQRGATYGDFSLNAIIAQEMKVSARNGASWDAMPAYIQEGIDIILSKISRAVTGDPMHADNFHDIAGYAKLVEDRINKWRAERDKVDTNMRITNARNP